MLMPKPIDVAKYLLLLAAQEPEAELVTHLRLQKLLYYVQGWSLAIRKNPMFDGIIQAWKHGPVVCDVYQDFAKYEKNPIPPQDDVESIVDISDEDKAFIESIWASYKRFSAVELRRMTHLESPWKSARGELSPEAWSRKEISQASMIHFFRDEFSKHIKEHGLQLEQIWEAEADVAAGRTMSSEDVLARLNDGI